MHLIVQALACSLQNPSGGECLIFQVYCRGIDCTYVDGSTSAHIIKAIRLC